MRRALAALLLVPLAAPPAAADLLLTGFATDLPGGGMDDAFELWNRGNETVRLETVTVGDGEGTVAFPFDARLAAGERARVALNRSAYIEAARERPDYAVEAPSEAQRLRVLGTGIRLAQDGDELLLRDGGALLDAVAWGDSNYTGPGWRGPPVPVPGDAFLRWVPRWAADDTDAAADWDHPQRPRLGWKPPDRTRFTIEGDAVAYTAPDQSRSMVSGLIVRANQTLRLNVYDLRDVGLARDLLARMRDAPGLLVRVLVDESPVGLDPEERMVRNRILQDLVAAGAAVRLLRHDRYAYDHAKYLVVDDRYALVQSENLVASGAPSDARSGNRGWGIVLDDRGLASGLASLFERDFALDAYGARPPGPDENATAPLPPFISQRPRPRLATATASAFNATLLAGPETQLGASDALLESIRDARSDIVVEHLQLPPVWRDATGRDWPNRYLDALLDAAGRGVRVRILLDGHFLDGSDLDNAATAAAVAARAPGRPIEVRLVTDPDSPVLHVKGVVVDGRVAFVGSMNGNLNSVAQNREVTLRVDAPALAAFYRDAFEADWGRPAGGRPLGDGLGAAASALALVALAAAGANRRRG